MIWKVKVVCAGCGCHWAWETIDHSIQLEMFEMTNTIATLNDEDIEIERSCPTCKAAAKLEAGIGPQFARSLADERFGRTFRAWSPHRRTA